MSASIWNPGGTLIPQADPNSQVKSEVFTATAGQTLFNITEFTYVTNNGALQVYINGAKQASDQVVEASTSSFTVTACEAGDVVEVVGNTAIADATGAAAAAAASAAAALVSEGAAAASAVTASSAASAASGSAGAASASETNAAASAALAATFVPLDWEGAWLTATAYQVNDAVKEAGASYICIVAHTSGVFAADVIAGNWDTIAEKGAAGAGAGDMVAANNLSDLANIVTARANLGLGTAATTAATAYATAAQGATADTAVQPAAIANMLETVDIGVSVQGYDVDTAKLDVAQIFTASQRGTLTVDNDASFNQAATNKFKCTPAGAAVLTFTNHTSGQGGIVVFINSANYNITAAATTYIAAADLVKLRATGTYLIGYEDDGTNAYCSVSTKLTSAGV